MLRPPARVAVLLLMLMAPFALSAQNVQPVQQPPMNWVPQGFEVLGQRAAVADHGVGVTEQALEHQARIAFHR